MSKLTYKHGEVGIYQIDQLPTGLKKVETKAPFYILANSETSGNHHVLEKAPEIELFERDGVLYMKNTAPAKVSCVIKERHDTEIIPPGIWEIDKSQEFDYEAGVARDAAD